MQVLWTRRSNTVWIRQFSRWLFVLACCGPISAKVVVFWQDAFPTIDSQAIDRSALRAALSEWRPVFSNLTNAGDLAGSAAHDLLVMPYGSAVPVDAWMPIQHFLKHGGNLLVLGGQPFRTPVRRDGDKFIADAPEEAFSRDLGILHTYEAPQKEIAQFGWKEGYEFLPKTLVDAQKFFVLEGRFEGLGYMRNQRGERIAAPIVIANHAGSLSGDALGSRFVFLDFIPKPGYWESANGNSLIHSAAAYAQQDATMFSIEAQYATLRPGEWPELVVHVRDAAEQRANQPKNSRIKMDLLSNGRTIAGAEMSLTESAGDHPLVFRKTLSPGFYTVRGTYLNDGSPREFTRTGFWVAEPDAVAKGPRLGVLGDFLSKDGKPFFPFGTNYFTTEENGWDFSGPRNAAVWERDFAEMEAHGVSFVRTGVWNGQLKFLTAEGSAPERFLRNVEAYLLSAQLHHIAVNFTFFAFDPQTTFRPHEDSPSAFLPGSNPYLDPVTIRAEQNYLLSIVARFKSVPYLCWDLINEPSFSNPRRLWHANTPNNDPAELQAWHAWLRGKYIDTSNLAAAWSVTPDQIPTFDSAALPNEGDLTMNLEHGQAGQIRAVDYNLFAQEMFAHWTRKMVDAIRREGSTQLIDVGQDEGGVQDRLLNQFYAASGGLSFTTNHTYRQNSALLWDSLAAKVPGVPNIVGETGYQPIILPNGDWRFDEITGAGLIERKWVEGFAGGSTGALSWDWAREVHFGIERSDGSDKVWVNTMREMGAFAAKAQSYATGLILPDVALILPQSLQLSEFNRLSIEAQQNAVRALYGYARSEAYAVGEDQIARLGNPKLIILPSPWVVNEKTWAALVRKVNEGATLLVSGRFDLDDHFRPTDRAATAGIPYRPGQLFTRDNTVAWAAGNAHLLYSGTETDFLERALLDDGKTFAERPLGNGKILFSAFPLELNQNLEAVGQIYRYALQAAGVSPVYSTGLQNSGIVICPTRFPHATLYTITSESESAEIAFTDEISHRPFTGQLAPGRAALLLISDRGDLLASYNWK